MSPRDPIEVLNYTNKNKYSDTDDTKADRCTNLPYDIPLRCRFEVTHNARHVLFFSSTVNTVLDFEKEHF